MYSGKEWQELNLNYPWQCLLDDMNPSELIKVFPAFSYGMPAQCFFKQNYIWILLKESYGYSEDILEATLGDELRKWCARPDPIVSSAQRIKKAALILRQSV